MIEWLKLLLYYAVWVAGFVVGVGVLAFVMTIVGDLAEERPWVIPLVFILFAILLVTTVAYFDGWRAPW